jgi:hypothetical protein
VNVWIWNGEDPAEEMQRRIMAAALHFDLTPADLQGRLFVDSGRLMPVCIAVQTKGGAVLNAPHVDAVKATIKANMIGLMIVDPFVSSHTVTENDTTAMSLVARAWAQIADETRCAIELVHHSRKTNGLAITVEDGRGAVALLNAARSARTLNVMTKDEAGEAGVDEARFYFRLDNGKANLAPPPERSTWHRLVSVPLGNERPDRPGDNVAVVSAWKWPSAFDGVTVHDLRAVQAKVHGAEWRADAQSPAWVGKAVANALDLDADEPAVKSKVKGLLKVWIETDALRIVERPDASRRPKKFVEVGEWATD